MKRFSMYFFLLFFAISCGEQRPNSYYYKNKDSTYEVDEDKPNKIKPSKIKSSKKQNKTNKREKNEKQKKKRTF